MYYNLSRTWSVYLQVFVYTISLPKETNSRHQLVSLIFGYVMFFFEQILFLDAQIILYKILTFLINDNVTRIDKERRVYTQIRL